jgi:hypothetical protein
MEGWKGWRRVVKSGAGLGSAERGVEIVLEAGLKIGLGVWEIMRLDDSVRSSFNHEMNEAGLP